MSDKRQLAEAYRPALLSHVIGQESAVKKITGLLSQKSPPHSILVSGKSGVGKTTLARIIGLSIAHPKNTLPKNMARSSPDYHEYDMGGDRGIDHARSILAASRYKPRGDYNVFAIDEIAKATPQAFSPMLKVLEEPPKQSVFILITDEPEKLPVTIQNRCYKISLDPLTKEDLEKIVNRVAKNESISFPSKKIIKYIASHAQDARTALTLLQEARDAAIGETDYKNILKTLRAVSTVVEKQAVILLTALYKNKHAVLFKQLLQNNGNSVGLLIKLLSYNQWLMEQATDTAVWSNNYTDLFTKYLDKPPTLARLSHTHNVLVNLKRDIFTLNEFDQKHLMLARLGSLVLTV